MREDRFKRLVDAVCDHGGATRRRKPSTNGRVVFQWHLKFAGFS